MKTRFLAKAIAIAATVALPLTGMTAAAYAGGPNHCPPGLAKKGSCVPPGQQKKWAKGDRIPDGVRYRVIVRYDDYRLPRPRPGHVYIETGRDIYLIAEATKRVIQAVNLVEKATR